VKKQDWLVVVAAALVLVPIVYFLVRFCDGRFRDAAIASWFGTVIGVVVGIPIALAVNRHQVKLAEAASVRAAKTTANTRLWLFLLNIGFELQANKDQLSRLEQILGKPRESRKDMWDVAKEIGDALAISAFKDLRQSQEFGSVFPAGNALVAFYLTLQQLKADVRTAASLHDFYGSFGGGQVEADRVWKTTQQAIKLALQELARAEVALGGLQRDLEHADPPPDMPPA